MVTTFHNKHILHLNKYISLLSPDDYALFRQMFTEENTISFAHSWLYTLRSGRIDQGIWGYKYYDCNTLFSIGYRHNTIYLSRIFQKIPDTSVIIELCRTLSKELEANIVLKKVDDTMSASLLKTGEFVVGDLLMINFEDETYPETLLSLRALFSKSGQFAKPLATKIRRFEKVGLELTTIYDWKRFSHNEVTDYLRILSEGNHEKFETYLPMIATIFQHPSDYKTCLFINNGTIHGLYIAEILSHDSLGLYCALSSMAYPGLTEWMDITFFRYLYNKDVDFLYLGGAETKGVQRYVKKLSPTLTAYTMRPLVYRSRYL